MVWRALGHLGLLDHLAIRFGGPTDHLTAVVNDMHLWPELQMRRDQAESAHNTFSSYRVANDLILRRNSDLWILERLQHGVQVQFADARWIAALARLTDRAAGAVTGHGAAAHGAGTSTRQTNREQKLLKALYVLGFLENRSDRRRAPATTWEFHDRYFHFQTRFNLARSGKRLKPRQSSRSLQASKQTAKSSTKHGKIRFSQAIRLPRLHRSIERPSDQRRLIRQHSHEPASLNDVSQLLAATQLGHYPSAGGLYENSVYLVVNTCHGLPKGFYSYDRKKHALRKVMMSKRQLITCEETLAMAAHSYESENGTPQMVAIITSRIRLISAEYSKIAYRLSLLNCGVILGALDRRCHELGLAGCCLGGSDSSFFQKLTGCNLAEETSMAEFAFGRARN